jgi:hypothetical protein
MFGAAVNNLLKTPSLNGRITWLSCMRSLELGGRAAMEMVARTPGNGVNLAELHANFCESAFLPYKQRERLRPDESFRLRPICL